jgi:tRNA (Thr-GGU) A37 N-methylase
MNEVTYRPIGVVHSPFKEPKNVPIQVSASKGIQGSIEVNPEYAEGLKDLEGFSHIILLYHFSLVKACSLLVKPFLDDNLHGVRYSLACQAKRNWHIHCTPYPNRKQHTIHSRCRHFRRHATFGH